MNRREIAREKVAGLVPHGAFTGPVHFLVCYPECHPYSAEIENAVAAAEGATCTCVKFRLMDDGSSGVDSALVQELLRDCIFVHGGVVVAKLTASSDGDASNVAVEFEEDDRFGLHTMMVAKPVEQMPACADAIEAYNNCEFDAALGLFLTIVLGGGEVALPSTTAAFNAAALLHQFGYTALAVPLAQKVVEQDPADATSHTFLADVLADGAPHSVARALAQVIERNPNNVKAKHRLAVLSGQHVKRGDPRYAQEIYDNMAEVFEERLVEHLHYRVPWQTHDALFELLQVPQNRHLERADADITVCTPLEGWQAKLPALGSWTMVDLGCGSGLVGKLFRHLAAPDQSGKLVGVDISPKMVDLCRDKGWYDELHVADIHEVLQGTPAGSTTMVVAADTFIYIGDLDDAFRLAGQALMDGGLFAFSVEDCDRSPMKKQTEQENEDGFTLVASGRYAHTWQYLDNLARQHPFHYHFVQRITLLSPKDTFSLRMNKLGQSLNTAAISSLWRYIWSPALLAPHFHVKSLAEIDWELLHRRGVRAVLLDKDNTVTEPYKLAVEPSVKVSLQQCLDTFGRDHVAILSNSAGTNDDREHKHAMEIEQHLEVPVIRHRVKKPGCLDEVLDHFNKRSSGDLCAEQLVMVGDRVLTDIAFGNLYGMLTVLVDPFTAVGDNRAAATIRNFERETILPFLKARGLAAPTHKPPEQIH